MKMGVVGQQWPRAGKVGLLLDVFCVCILCWICSFRCLPDETCSNGSPVFAGYFLPPIWKKMGSEDR